MLEPSHRICWNGWNDRNETNGRNETPQLNVYDANRQSQLCSNEALFPFASVFMRQIFSLFNLSIRNGMSCDETRWKRTKKALRVLAASELYASECVRVYVPTRTRQHITRTCGCVFGSYSTRLYNTIHATYSITTDILALYYQQQSIAWECGDV